MKTCPFCPTTNEDTWRFCRQCGQMIDSLILSTGEPAASGACTVLLSGKAAQSAPQRRSRQPLREPARADRRPRPRLRHRPATPLRLALPTPSSCKPRTAASSPTSAASTASRSTANASTNRHLIREERARRHRPVSVLPRGRSIQSLDSSQRLRLEARALEKAVTGFDGKPKKLLDDINLVVNPGEFVTLLGPPAPAKAP